MTAESSTAWKNATVPWALGGCALAAQALLFRDFLSAFESHELAVGLFFSSWLVWLAVGALVGRLRAAWVLGSLRHFDLLLLAYLPAFVLQQTLLQEARVLTQVPAYELFPWLRMLAIAVPANAPVSLLTGFLFTLACRWPPLAAAPWPVARVFILESLGSASGAAAATLLLAAGISEEAIFLDGALLLVLLLAARYRGRARWLLGGATALLLAALLLGWGGVWQQWRQLRHWSRLLPPAAYRGAFVTPQARYLYGEQAGQFQVLCGESVVATFPNDAPASERLALLLAQQPAAQRVLLIGPEGPALVRRLRRLPRIAQIVWLHPDPDYPRRVLAALPPEAHLGMDNFAAPPSDARTYLANNTNLFDAVLLNLPDPATLTANRYLTVEFFKLLQARLAPAGVVGVRLAGGENYLGAELIQIGASMVRTLGSVFPRLALKPGDETWLFAARDAPLSEDAAELGRRWLTIPGAAAVFPVAGFDAAWPPDRVRFQWQAYRSALRDEGGRSPPSGVLAGRRDAQLNTDQRPLAPLFNLLLLGKQYGWSLPWLAAVLPAGPWLGCALALAALIYFFLRLIYVRRTARRTPANGVEPAFDYYVLIATTGFAGMTTSLVLLFLYQMRYGALFLHLGLISALFMLGLTLGARLGAELAARWPGRWRGWLALTLSAQAGLLAFVVTGACSFQALVLGTFILLAGVFQGVYIPLAGVRWQAAGLSTAASGAAVEALDNLGGAAGGLLTGLMLLPMLGMAGTVLVAMGCVAINFAALLLPVAGPMATAGDTADRWVRRLGYALGGCVLWLLLVTGWIRHGAQAHAPDRAAEFAELAALAREWLPDAQQEARILPAEGGAEASFLELRRGTEVLYLIRSDHLAAPENGYGGPLVLALLLRADGTLADFSLLQNRETPAYLQRLSGWLASLKGRKLTSPAESFHVDAVSGATITARALAHTFQRAGAAFAVRVLRQDVAARMAPRERGGRAWADGFFALLLIAALLLRLRPRPWVRRLWLLLVLAACGVWLNAQYSLQGVAALVRGQLPPFGLTLPFLLVVAVPLLVALLGNFYCGWLCPFGAAQELVGWLRPRRWRTEPRRAVGRYGRLVKYALLGLVLVLYAVSTAASMDRADPLITFFSGFAEQPVLWIALAALMCALFFGRFWCRNVCPAGAFLALAGGLPLLPRRWRPATKPSCCDYGVRHTGEFDCLCCDRCRMPAARPELKSAAPRLFQHEIAWLLAVVGAAAAFLALLHGPVWPTWGGLPAGASALSPAATGATVQALPPQTQARIRELIRQQKLSEREAKYYKAASNAAPPAAVSPSTSR